MDVLTLYDLARSNYVDIQCHCVHILRKNGEVRDEVTNRGRCVYAHDSHEIDNLLRQGILLLSLMMQRMLTSMFLSKSPRIKTMPFSSTRSV